MYRAAGNSTFETRIMLHVLLTWAARWRRNLPASRQAWTETLVAALLLSAAGGLWWYGKLLTSVQQVFLWALFVAVLALVGRRGWLKLFGPVLFYDLVRSARRGRFGLLRCFYAGLLLLTFFFVYATRVYSRTHRIEMIFTSLDMPPRESIEFAASCFYWFMGIQYMAACLLTPAYTAGVIAEERERGTLDYLLTTDLHNRELVFGVLVSRFANLALVVLTGLPILSLLQFLGGVDPNLLLAGYAAVGLTLASVASLGILHSVYVPRPREAITRTYLVGVVYMVVASMSQLLAEPRLGLGTMPLWGSGPRAITVEDAVAWVNAGNPVWAVQQMRLVLRAGASLDKVLPALVAGYAWFHGVLALVCTTWAVAGFRSASLRPTVQSVRQRAMRRRYRFRPRVGRWPMMWKELFVESGPRLGWFLRICLACFVAITFLPGLTILAWHVMGLSQPWRTVGESMNEWLRPTAAFVGTLMLLAVAIRASGSVSNERDRQTMDALLTSPLDSTAILFAKWLASIVSPRWTAVWLASVAMLGLATGGLHFWGALAFIAAWLVFAAFMAALGMWFTVVSRTTQRATLWTVLTTLGVCGGHWLIWICLIPLASWLVGRGMAEEWLIGFQAIGLTPPITLFVVAFTGNELRGYGYGGWGGGFGLNDAVLAMLQFAMILWGLGAVSLWVMAGMRFRKAIGRSAVLRPERRVRHGARKLRAV
jgi:ABC-type transport system involved in multi-copper enzyme maturation permease subunit